MKKIVCIIILILLNFNLVYAFNIIRAERDFNVAVDLYNSKDYNTALFQFSKFIETYPNSEYVSDAFYWSAECMYNLNQFDEAIEKFQYIINNYPNYRNIALVYIGLGHSYFSLKDYASSRYYFETVKPLLIKDMDVQVEIEFKIIESYFFQDRYESVIDFGNRFISRYNDYEQRCDYVRYLIAESYFIREDYNNVVKTLETINKTNVSGFYSDAFYLLARTYERLNKMEDSKKTYKHIINYDINYRNIGIIHYNLAWIYFRENNYDTARDYFEKVTTDFTTAYKDARFRIGQIYHLENRYEDSIKSLMTFLNEITDYNYNEANYILARNYYLQRDMNNTLKYIEKAFEFGKLEEKYLILRLNALYRLQKYENLITVYEKYKDNIITTSNSEPMTYLFIKSLFNVADYSKAEAHYKTFLNSFPDSKFYNEIRKELADIYFYSKKYSQAINHFLRLKSDDGLKNFRDEITYYLALSYYNNGAIGNSIFEFKEIYETYANSEYIEPALLYLSRIYSNRRNHSESKKWAEILIKEYPTSKLFAESLFYKGMSEYFLRDYNAAISTLSKISDKHKNIDEEKLHRAHIFRGIANYQIEKYDLAITDLTFIIKKSQDKILLNDALFYRGLSNYRLNKFEISLADLQNVDINYLSEIFLSSHKYYLALTYYNLKQYEDSLQITKNFNQIYDDNRIAEDIDRLNYLNIYYLEKYDEAYQTLLRLLENKNHKYYLDNLFYITKTTIELNRLENGLKYSNELINHKNYNRYYEALFDNGRIMYLLNNYDEAIEVLKLASAVNDIDMKNRIYFIIGKCYEHKHNNIQAIDSFSKILSVKDNNPLYEDALFNIGINYFKNNDYRQSIDYFKRLYAEFPESEYIPENFSWIGKAYFNLNFYPQSIEEYKKLLDYDNNDGLIEEAVYSIAVAYYNLENFNDAIQFYTKLITEYPESENAANSKYGIGLCYQKLGNEPEFIKHYEELIDMYPERSLAPAALFELGQYFYGNENYKEAVFYYKKLIDNYQEFSLIDNVIYNLGTSQYALQEYELAQETFEDFIQKYPTEAGSEMTYYFLGNIMFENRNYEKVIENFQHIKDKSLLNEVYYKKGVSYYYLKNYIEALNFLMEVKTETFSSELKNHITFLIGDSLIKINKENEAATHFSNLMDMDVKEDYMEYVNKFLFNYYLENNENDKAVNYLEKYIINYPDVENINDIIYLCASTAYKINNYSVAEKYFSRLINSNAEKYLEVSLTNLSEIYIKNNNNISYIAVIEKKIDNNYHLLSDLVKLLDVYYTEKQFDKYIFLNERIIEEHPRHIEGLNSLKRLAEIYEEQNQIEKSIEYYHKYLDRLPREKNVEGAAIQFKIGKIHYDKEDYQESIIELWKVRFFKNPDVEGYNYMDKAYYYIIRSYVKMNDMHNAQVQFENFKREMPESEYIKKLSEILN